MSQHDGQRSRLVTFARCAVLALLALVTSALIACASSTTAQLTPSPQPPVCQASAKALVLWLPQWRPDQKDVPAREAAAAEGIAHFFATSGCFASTVVQRIAQPVTAAMAAAVPQAQGRYDKLVVLTVRELGPTVKLGSSLALVEGGTEVVLDLAEYRLPDPSPQRTFTVQWRDGGPGFIKGVATLPQDIAAALAAGMQPAAR